MRSSKESIEWRQSAINRQTRLRVKVLYCAQENNSFSFILYRSQQWSQLWLWERWRLFGRRQSESKVIENLCVPTYRLSLLAMGPLLSRHRVHLRLWCEIPWSSSSCMVAYSDWSELDNNKVKEGGIMKSFCTISTSFVDVVMSSQRKFGMFPEWNLLHKMEGRPISSCYPMIHMYLCHLVMHFVIVGIWYWDHIVLNT